MSYDQQVSIPTDFFTKTLKEYQDWRMVWFRETIQNAMDAKATQIAFSIKKIKQSIQLSVSDNGCGMDINRLRNGFLTLGGSIKTRNNLNPIGGFGYAKHIILFAHQHYQITTQDNLVTGQGNQYTIDRASQPFKGTKIAVTLHPTEDINVLKQCCQELVSHTRTTVKIFLNDKCLTTDTHSYTYHAETALGSFHFCESIKPRDMRVWVRIQGLPMFRYALNNMAQKGLNGVLDIQGKPTDWLTSNRESLNHQYNPLFEQFISDLLYQREQFKPNHEIVLIINPADKLIAKYRQDKKVVSIYAYFLRVIMPEERKTLPYSKHEKRFKSIIENLQHLADVLIYPDNFFLSFQVSPSDKLVRYTQIKKLLHLKRNQKLAWCWHYAIGWIIETEVFQSFFHVQFDKKDNPTLVDVIDSQKLPLYTGFIIDNNKEGLNDKRSQDIRLFINPNYFTTDWLVSDVIDLAIHECAHCIEANHGEYFSDIELQIRRELRRFVDDAEILEEAEKTLLAVHDAIKSD